MKKPEATLLKLSLALHVLQHAAEHIVFGLSTHPIIHYIQHLLHLTP